MSGFPWGQPGQIANQNAPSDDGLPEDVVRELQRRAEELGILKDQTLTNHAQQVAQNQSEQGSIFKRPSPRALQASVKKARTSTGEGVWAGIEEAFVNCPAGMSFEISAEGLNDKNFRVMVSRKAKKLNRIYSVIKLEKTYEIYRRE